MAKQKKVKLPSSQGGIVSYSDSDFSYIQIKPTTVMAFCCSNYNSGYRC